MPAPKQGLDWFPFDVDLLDDEALDFLREQYGVVVNDIYVALLTLLYRKKGYYVPYETKKEKEDCVWYIYKRVRGGKYPVQQDAIPTVIEACVARQLFSGELYPKIITSERAQRTYYSATVDRKLESFDLRPEYWLLDDATMRKLSKKHPYYLFLHRNDILDGTKSISGEMQVKSGEMPLDKIRVNNISNDILKESKKEIYKKESSTYENFNPDSTEPPMRKDGSYDFDYFEKHRSHKSIMDEFRITGYYRKTLEEFLRYCYANGHTVMNQTLDNLICRLDEYYGQDDVEKIKSLERAMQNGYYDIKELKR